MVQPVWDTSIKDGVVGLLVLGLLEDLGLKGGGGVGFPKTLRDLWSGTRRLFFPVLLGFFFSPFRESSSVSDFPKSVSELMDVAEVFESAEEAWLFFLTFWISSFFSLEQGLFLWDLFLPEDLEL